MPSITDWLMVAITAIYVFATIAICWANIKSAKATREQLIESKRQYEDSKKLSTMPYLQAGEFDGMADHRISLALNPSDLGGGEYILKIKISNIGNGTAKNIRYKWNNFAKSYDRGDFPIRALRSGDEQSVTIVFTCPRIIADITFASFDLTYEDLLENTYGQRLLFGFERKNDKLTLNNYLMCPPYSIKKEDSHA